MIFRLAILLFSVYAVSACAANNSTLVAAENVKWGYLNPLRGDKSPAAANLWGDRSNNVATGMLVKFKKGFSSPPHIHNISYRGVVIEGLMHNDDPKAEKLWLPATSYWTQTAGENHITAANGESNLIYLEIDSGPYLVKPASQQFDNGERPVNIHASNIVWLDHTESSLISGTKVQIAHLWQKSENATIQGYLIKLAAGAKVQLTTQATEFRSVVIQSNINYSSLDQPKTTELAPGSYFSSQGNASHILASRNQSVIYIRTDGLFSIE
ncbi:hypothetical protein DS2_08877 [Catenovulum agarivorans DS-2]|uniref:DUF4437 domain-containing protein n=1 Tax=Catenovulum agarivorans DS-2 TaxID=1328313 RepID=W7QE52_9ALTE|nr:DUF4437 domain-containing protein [Catenovulum agarivorans]EWH10201.1 hypothetical protein DS2_08877 [Catenovulum agarivorans DS-2]